MRSKANFTGGASLTFDHLGLWISSILFTLIEDKTHHFITGSVILVDSAGSYS
jgi:hypothetical protein